MRSGSSPTRFVAIPTIGRSRSGSNSKSSARQWPALKLSMVRCTRTETSGANSLAGKFPLEGLGQGVVGKLDPDANCAGREPSNVEVQRNAIIVVEPDTQLGQGVGDHPRLILPRPGASA